jgi:hypothetical protein
MSDEDKPILTTRPLDEGEKLLQQKYVEAVAGQSALMDELAKHLITIELAIPGLYATVLKLRQGEGATVKADFWFYLTVICWFLALALVLISLIPRDYDVDTSMLQSDPVGRSRNLSIEDFFRQSAVYKRRLLIVSVIFFWTGIVSAVFVGI